MGKTLTGMMIVAAIGATAMIFHATSVRREDRSMLQLLRSADRAGLLKARLDEIEREDCRALLIRSHETQEKMTLRECLYCLADSMVDEETIPENVCDPCGWAKKMEVEQ